MSQEVTAALLPCRHGLDLLLTQRGLSAQKLLRGAGAQPRGWILRMKSVLGSSPSTQPLPLTRTEGHPESLGTPREPQATARMNPSLGRRDSRATSLVIRQEGMEMSKEKPRQRLGYWLRRDGDEQGCVRSRLFYRGRDGRRQNGMKSDLRGQNCPVVLLVPSRGLLCAGLRLQMGAPHPPRCDC